MASILFLAFKQARQNETVRRLQHAGHRVVVAEPRYPEFKQAADAMRPPPDVVVVEGSWQPSHGRESVGYLRETKAYGGVAVVFFNVKPEDEAAVRAKVADARIVRLEDLVQAVQAG